MYMHTYVFMGLFIPKMCLLEQSHNALHMTP